MRWADRTRCCELTRRRWKATTSSTARLRTTLTKLAENGAYYKEFITQSDWFHTGEGMRAFMFLGFPIRTTSSFASA